MTTHSSILAGRIPWTEEPGGLQSIPSQRVWHDWSSLACTHPWTYSLTLFTSAKRSQGLYFKDRAKYVNFSWTSTFTNERKLISKTVPLRPGFRKDTKVKPGRQVNWFNQSLVDLLKSSRLLLACLISHCFGITPTAWWLVVTYWGCRFLGYLQWSKEACF